MVHLLWRTVWRFLKKLKIKPSYDLAIALLGIYPEKMKTLIQKDTCTPVFTAALFTIDKTWKQPKCPIHTHTHTRTHTHTEEYYSAIKNNEILPFAATWMDIENIILSKSDRERQILYDIIYMWNLKNNTNESIHRTEADSQT